MNENRSKSPSVVSAGVVVVVGVEITGSDTDSTQDICNRLHRHVLLAL